MSCRYLTSRARLLGLETSECTDCPACRLGRPLDPTAWAARCRNTSPEGPCWIWAEIHGDLPDPEYDTPVELFQYYEQNRINQSADT